MKKMLNRAANHRHKSRAGIHFPYNNNLIGLIRIITYARWSTINSFWHVDNSPESIGKLKPKFNRTVKLYTFLKQGLINDSFKYYWCTKATEPVRFKPMLAQPVINKSDLQVLSCENVHLNKGLKNLKREITYLIDYTNKLAFIVKPSNRKKQ